LAAVETETSQRSPQRSAGFDQANTSSRSSGDRAKASDLPAATALKNEPVFQASYTSDPATGTRMQQSATSAHSHNLSNPGTVFAARHPNIACLHITAPVVSGAPPRPLLASQPNPRTRDQLDSEPAVRTTSTPTRKPSVPERQNPSTQNVNAIPTPVNPWSM